MEAYFNSINNINKKFNISKKLTDLKIDKKYTISEFKNVKTKYGISKILTIIDENNEYVDVFLPNRYNNIEFNHSAYPHCLIYHGKKPMKNGQEFHDVEFQN